MEETRPGGSPRSVATFEDFEKLQTLLIRHFDGVTILPNSVGYVLRGERVELNKHVPFVVYAAATTASDLYFQTLRKELEEALLQETVLVERHEVWLH